MVALFALSFDLVLVTGIASVLLVLLCLRAFACCLSALEQDSGQSEGGSGR